MQRLPQLIALAAVTLAACGAAHARSSFDNVTSVVAQRVAGGLVARADEPAAVAALMREVNAERGKQWQGYRGKLGACAVRLSFFEHERRVGRLVLDGSSLIEFTGAAETTGVVRDVPRQEMRTVRRFAGNVQSQAGCDR